MKMSMDDVVKAYGNRVIRFRLPLVIISLMLVGLAASGGRFIQFKNDYRYYFSQENPQLKEFEILQNTYNKNDNILFALKPEGSKVFVPEFLDAVEDLTREAWKIPYAVRVDSVTNFQSTKAQGDDLYIKDLVENAFSKTRKELLEAERTALAEPLLRNRLISDNAQVTGVNVTLELPGQSNDEQSEAVLYARELADRIKAKHSGVEIYLTGLVPLDHAFMEASTADMQTLVPLMYLAIILAMTFLLRSFSGTLATVCVIAFSVLTAMGTMGWMGIPLTSPSANAPTMIMTLAVAGCIHVLVTLFREMQYGCTKDEAIVESLRVNMQPVFLTGFTTCIGFLSMNFSEVPPFRDLGNVTAIGVLASFIYTIVFLPAFMAILPLRVKPHGKGRFPNLDFLADFVITKRHPLLWVSIILVVLSAAMIPRNELDDSWIDYFDESIPFRTHTEFVHENLTGVYQIEYSLGSGESYGITKPEYLADVEKFALWWRSKSKVVHVNSFTDIMKRLSKNMHGDDPDFYRIPKSRELAAQYLLLYEMSLPYGLDLNNQINIDKSSIRFTVTMENSSMKEIKQAALEGEIWLRENATPSMFSHGVGTAVMFAYISERNIRSMLIGTSAALLLISFTLILALRSVKYGLLSLVPNLVPAVTAFGLWGIVVGEVNMGISVVSAMTLGIVVDDTVHFLSKFIRARREQGLEVEDAVRYAFSSVGMAMIVTSLVLIVGFVVLSFSTFYVTGSMGCLTAITIAIALVADFLLLPPVLLYGKKSEVVSEDARSS